MSAPIARRATHACDVRARIVDERQVGGCEFARQRGKHAELVRRGHKCAKVTCVDQGPQPRSAFVGRIDEHAGGASAGGNLNQDKRRWRFPGALVGAGDGHHTRSARSTLSRPANGGPNQICDVARPGRVRESELDERGARCREPTGGVFNRCLVHQVAERRCDRPRTINCVANAIECRGRHRAERSGPWVLRVDVVGAALESGLRFGGIADADQKLHRALLYHLVDRARRASVKRQGRSVPSER